MAEEERDGGQQEDEKSSEAKAPTGFSKASRASRLGFDIMSPGHIEADGSASRLGFEVDRPSYQAVRDARRRIDVQRAEGAHGAEAREAIAFVAGLEPKVDGVREGEWPTKGTTEQQYAAYFADLPDEAVKAFEVVELAVSPRAYFR